MAHLIHSLKLAQALHRLHGREPGDHGTGGLEVGPKLLNVDYKLLYVLQQLPLKSRLQLSQHRVHLVGRLQQLAP